MKKYVIYQRVSTEEQAEKGYSLEAMLDKCEHYIKSQEDACLTKVYEDRGLSGTLGPTKRPALAQLLNDLKMRAACFDTVLVWKLDRLSRSMRDTLNIEHILRRQGVALESVTERVDTSTAAGKMFFNTVASFAEFESAQIGERTRNAMSAKVGEIMLGGDAPMGYSLQNGRLVLSEDSRTIRTVFRKFLLTKNLSKVARFLNQKRMLSSKGMPWDHEKVKRALLNPVYYGCTVWGRRNKKLRRINPENQWIVKRETHQPIVSERVFRRTQEILNGRRH